MLTVFLVSQILLKITSVRKNYAINVISVTEYV